jgi:L-threonylcarbamoyladenylate synthase
MIFANDFTKNARLLLAGGVSAIPTEGVWGLSCAISKEHSIERILRVKQRDPAKGLITLVATFDELAHWFACPVLEVARDEVGRPSTWIIPVNSDCPKILTGGRDSMAVRRVTMPSLVRLIDYVGPLVSTSANRSGRPAFQSRWQVMNQLGHAVDYVARGRTQGYRKPSTIRDMQTGTIIRD